MKKIHIITDSTSELSKEFAQENAITIVPLSVNFGNTSYLDGVDITPDSFYEKLQASKELPTTSQVSVGAFVEVYNQLKETAETILSIHISQRLSGTYQGAVMAAKEVGGTNIMPYDARTTSVSLGNLVKIAVEGVKEGLDAQTIIKRLDKARAQQLTIFSVGTLEYLEKGGRIGKAQALVGNLLKIKPLLMVDEAGYVAPFEKIRGKRKVLKRLEDIFAQYLADHGEDSIKSMIYGNNLQEANTFKEELEKKYGVQDMDLSQLGPVVGTHVGPDVVGMSLTPQVK